MNQIKATNFAQLTTMANDFLVPKVNDAIAAGFPFPSIRTYLCELMIDGFPISAILKDVNIETLNGYLLAEFDFNS